MPRTHPEQGPSAGQQPRGPKQRLQTNPPTLQTVERALAVLERVAESETPLKVKDVAKALGLNVTTSYHLTNTLGQAGYLIKDESGHLRIGPRAALLYRGMILHFDPVRDLQGILNDVAQRSGETAYLTALTDKGVVVQLLAEGTHSVRVSGISVGFSGSEHQRASGRAVLAFADKPVQQRIFNEATSHLPASRRKSLLKELLPRLEAVRRDGWALDNEEFEASVCCVAAPYFSSQGAIAGSLAVSLPAERFSGGQDALVAIVRNAAATVSELYGWHGSGQGAE